MIVFYVWLSLCPMYVIQTVFYDSSLFFVNKWTKTTRLIFICRPQLHKLKNASFSSQCFVQKHMQYTQISSWGLNVIVVYIIKVNKPILHYSEDFKMLVPKCVYLILPSTVYTPMTVWICSHFSVQVIPNLRDFH